MASFVNRFAPNLSIRPIDGGNDTGGSAGLTEDNHPYDSSGTPLPYIQNQDGTRQYFGSPAPQTQTPPTPPIGNVPPAQLRGFSQPDANPMPLRGLSQPDPDVPPTHNMLSSPGVRNGPNPVVRLPRAHPSMFEDSIIRGIQAGNLNPRTPGNVLNGIIQTGETGLADFNAAHPQQEGTLASLLNQFNYRLHGFTTMFDNEPSGSPSKQIGGVPGLRGRSDNVQEVSQRMPGMGPAAEIEALLRQSGLRLTEGAGVRTHNALAGGHPHGNAIDVPPNELEDAVRIIRADPRFADLPMRPMFIRRGQRFANGVVATGDHYHISLGPVANR